MKNIEPKYIWEEDVGTATVILQDDKGHIFKGCAFCHPADIDMISEKTGLQIAECRAVNKYLTHVRDNEIKPALAALTEYLGAIQHTPGIPKRAKGILYHRINALEADLELISKSIKDNKKYIHNYITDKEKFYQKIRKNRNQDKVE